METFLRPQDSTEGSFGFIKQLLTAITRQLVLLCLVFGLTAPGLTPARAQSLPAQTLRKQAYLSIQVADIDQAMARLNDLLQAGGGKITSYSMISQGSRSGRLTILAPSGSFEDLLTQISALGEQVLAQHASTEDLGPLLNDKYTARRSLENQRAHLIDIQKSAQTEAEGARLVEELDGVQSKLEALDSEISRLERSLVTGTIYLELWYFPPTATPTPTATPEPTGTPTPWDPRRTLDDVLNVSREAAICYLPGLLCLSPFALAVIISQALHRKRSQALS